MIKDPYLELCLGALFIARFGSTIHVEGELHTKTFYIKHFFCASANLIRILLLSRRSIETLLDVLDARACQQRVDFSSAPYF